MDLSVSESFERASADVLAYLADAVPMGLWTVSRYDGERQVLLANEGDQYEFGTGDSQPWENSLCQYAVTGATPKVAADAMTVPEYHDAPVSSMITIGSYIGMPIVHGDGELFGTLCAVDPLRRPADFDRHEPLLSLLASLLGRILDADLERSASAERLVRAEAAAETDVLTGLLNRRGWHRMADVAVDRCRRFADPATLLVIDIDNLKTVNDTEGHFAGDRLIAHVATVLRSVARSDDSVARLGGDEFAIMAACTPADGERMRERLERTLDAAGLHCSVGATALDARDSLATNLERADAVMYEHKRLRRSARTSHIALAG